MKKFGFLKITGSSLLAVFLLSFAAACTPKEEPSDVPAVQADSVLYRMWRRLRRTARRRAGSRRLQQRKRADKLEKIREKKQGKRIPAYLRIPQGKM